MPIAAAVILVVNRHMNVQSLANFRFILRLVIAQSKILDNRLPANFTSHANELLQKLSLLPPLLGILLPVLFDLITLY